jgi:SAM-dependent methyltransferase
MGLVDFGTLRRLHPISADAAAPRGVPIDVAYVARALERHADDIRGRVVEWGGDTCTRRHGSGRVTQSLVLHAPVGHPDFTTDSGGAELSAIPSDSVDCAIVAQALQAVADPRAMLASVQRILKPGGVALLTVPGIALPSGDRSRDATLGTRWWSFTPYALAQLLRERFPDESITVRACGNVLAVIAQLHGVASGELSDAELDAADPDYPVVVVARVVKR